MGSGRRPDWEDTVIDCQVTVGLSIWPDSGQLAQLPGEIAPWRPCDQGPGGTTNNTAHDATSKAGRRQDEGRAAIGWINPPGGSDLSPTRIFVP
jgi:hypothetical protein